MDCIIILLTLAPITDPFLACLELCISSIREHILTNQSTVSRWISISKRLVEGLSLNKIEIFLAFCPLNSTSHKCEECRMKNLEILRVSLTLITHLKIGLVKLVKQLVNIYTSCQYSSTYCSTTLITDQ